MTTTVEAPERRSIAEVEQRTGLTKDTLRWYERQGLIPEVERDSRGYRSYDNDAVRTIELVATLRRTGMPVRQMRGFVAMVAEGAASHGRRMALLSEHRDAVTALLTRLAGDLDAIDAKITHYSRLIEAGLDCNEDPVTDPEIARAQRSTR